VDLFSKLTVTKYYDRLFNTFCSSNSLPRANDFDCTHAPDISNVSDITDTTIGMNHLDTSTLPLPPYVNRSLLWWVGHFDLSVVWYVMHVCIRLAMENFEPPLTIALQLSIQRNQDIYPVMIPFAIHL